MKPFNKMKTKHAMNKIVKANEACIQFIDYLSGEYDSTFTEKEKEELSTMKTHINNLSNSLSNLK